MIRKEKAYFRRTAEKEIKMKKKMITAMILAMAMAAMTACGSKKPAQEPAQMTEEEQNAMGEEIADETDQMIEDLLDDADSMVDDLLEDFIGKIVLEGTWTDEISGRAEMDITALGDSTYDVLIHWGSSASEAAIWEFTGTYDFEGGILSYTDARHYTLELHDDGEEIIKDETTTSGALMKEGEKLRWQDSANEEDCLFKNVDVYNGIDGVYVNEESCVLAIMEREEGFDVSLLIDGRDYAGTLLDSGEGFVGELSSAGEAQNVTITREDNIITVTFEGGESYTFKADEVRQPEEQEEE